MRPDPETLLHEAGLPLPAARFCVWLGARPVRLPWFMAAVTVVSTLGPDVVSGISGWDVLCLSLVLPGYALLIYVAGRVDARRRLAVYPSGEVREVPRWRAYLP